jgi:cytochrome c oxidase subunit II
MFKTIWNTKRVMALAALASMFLTPAEAPAGTGQPSPWQIGLQTPATQVADDINWFHGFVNLIIVIVAAFVLILLAIAIYRFNERAHPTPSKTTHNTLLEVVWTVVPIFILVVIAIPSFKLLYFQYSYPKPDLTIKAIGNAWFWEHEYPDQGGFKVTSNILRDEDLLKAELSKAEFEQRYSGLEGLRLMRKQQADAAPIWLRTRQPRLLTVDNEIAVPVNKVVHVLVTANDVIHNWTIPSFGAKIDAVPGRITATWFKPTKTGVYYGQCSELCGKDHAFMPIAVRVVSEQAFNDWVAAAKARDWQKARSILRAATEEPSATKIAQATKKVE